ncbi:MAG: hypothetical protein KDE68_04275 [Rhodocyclaceae bacterium]|nr:hypothetical protein [Rhodocyclaceae bacterium]
MSPAGRVCPLRYRYGAAALASAPERSADTLYVVGGLYGNPPALTALMTLITAEPGPVTLCFNGDFNWFNVDDAGFAAVNAAVLAHDAILGNVEAELQPEADDAGCGCAYPPSVDAGVVERSNRIHARLKATAARHPAVLAQLAALPMFARYRVGDLRVGVVHGDADALAGWDFDAGRVDQPTHREHLRQQFAQAGVDVFASSHTCLPVCRHFGDGLALINNGAAGMPNFAGGRFGVVTRISTRHSPHPTLYGVRARGHAIDALALPYDHSRWMEEFVTNWPENTAASVSYTTRMCDGPAYDLNQARP